MAAVLLFVSAEAAVIACLFMEIYCSQSLTFPYETRLTRCAEKPSKQPALAKEALNKRRQVEAALRVQMVRINVHWGGRARHG